MKKKNGIFSRIKVVFHPSKPAIKIALLLVLVLSTTALIMLHSAIANQEAQREAARQAAIAQERENNKIQDLNDKAGTSEGIIDAAGKEFDWVEGNGQEFNGQTNP